MTTLDGRAIGDFCSFLILTQPEWRSHLRLAQLFNFELFVIENERGAAHVSPGGLSPVLDVQAARAA